MVSLKYKKLTRYWTARLGIYRTIRNLIFILRGQDHRKSAAEFYRKIISPGDLVFDVGANRGQSSEIYTSIGAKVVAFEPQKDLHREIRQLAAPGSNLTIIPLGLGNKEENRTFYMTEYDQVASLREDWEGERIGTSTITITTLDRQIEEHGLPAYCKVDVEGWELQVIEGLSRAIPLISFEYHDSENEIQMAKSVMMKLSELGSYQCNIKCPDKDSFLFLEFIPIHDFMNRFPNHLGQACEAGYGDVFCKLDQI
jgi:FkbM family methyltransferase